MDKAGTSPNLFQCNTATNVNEFTLKIDLGTQKRFILNTNGASGTPITMTNIAAQAIANLRYDTTSSIGGGVGRGDQFNSCHGAHSQTLIPFVCFFFCFCVVSFGQWFHVGLVVRSCSNSVDLYLNGVLIFTTPLITLPSMASRTCRTSEFDDTYIATMTVWNNSLATREVAALALTPTSNIAPGKLSILGNNLPNSLAPSANATIQLVLPFPLSLFGIATIQSYTATVVTAGGVTISSSTITFTDATPQVAFSFTMPPTESQFLTVTFTPINGDVSHYRSSSYTVWSLSSVNLLALSTWGTFMTSPVAVGSWSGSPPYYVRASGSTLIDWYTPSNTGRGLSGPVFPSTMGEGSQLQGGLTLAGLVRVNSMSGCFFDLIDTYTIGANGLGRYNFYLTGSAACSLLLTEPEGTLTRGVGSTKLCFATGQTDTWRVGACACVCANKQRRSLKPSSPSHR